MIRALADRGIDTVVTDHHHEPPAGELPDAVAILNPKLAGSSYPWRELCGGRGGLQAGLGPGAGDVGGGRRSPPS